jgi:hypothetical protein
MLRTSLCLDMLLEAIHDVCSDTVDGEYKQNVM